MNTCYVANNKTLTFFLDVRGRGSNQCQLCTTSCTPWTMCRQRWADMSEKYEIDALFNFCIQADSFVLLACTTVKWMLCDSECVSYGGSTCIAISFSFVTNSPVVLLNFSRYDIILSLGDFVYYLDGSCGAKQAFFSFFQPHLHNFVEQVMIWIDPYSSKERGKEKLYRESHF